MAEAEPAAGSPSRLQDPLLPSGLEEADEDERSSAVVAPAAAFAPVGLREASRQSVYGVAPRLGVPLGHSKGGKAPKDARAVESYDFDPWDSFVYYLRERNSTKWRYRRRAGLRWVLTFGVGVLTALVAVAVTFLARWLTSVKLVVFRELISEERSGVLVPGVSYMVLVSFALLYSGVAAFLAAFVEPMAAGSGIPEVKCVLNGVRIPRAVRFKTMVTKALGVAFSVASGLPVGKEGPMVNTGAVIASGISQGKSATFGVDTKWTRFLDFRNDREKRDFISCGAAAGVAAAFNAPVGGTLFSLEEGSSFWSQALTWRTFFCAMVSAYTINFFMSGINGTWGKLSMPGMFSFGDFTSTGQNQHGYNAWEIPVFLLMGIAGGLIGAAFNQLNKVISIVRKRLIGSSRVELFQVLAVAGIMASCSFALSVAFGHCYPRPDGDSEYNAQLVQLYCDNGYYNDVATVFLNPAEEAIRELFHFGSQGNAGGAFAPLTMTWCGLVYALLTCVTYGIAVPSGLFIPSLLAGSALGRATGTLLNHMLGSAVVDVGTYSLIGAAAVLGGMARMTISLAVIILECTGDYQFGLPLMVTLMFARWTGNMFNDGLYDIHIALRKWPLLEEKPPRHLITDLRVCDIMNRDLVTLNEVETVDEILHVLSTSSHNFFPVRVARSFRRQMRGSAGDGRYRLEGDFAGIIGRRHVAVLLFRRAFHAVPPEIALLPDDERARARRESDEEGGDEESPLPSSPVRSPGAAGEADGAAGAAAAGLPAAAAAGAPRAIANSGRRTQSERPPAHAHLRSSSGGGAGGEGSGEARTQTGVAGDSDMATWLLQRQGAVAIPRRRLIHGAAARPESRLSSASPLRMGAGRGRGGPSRQERPRHETELSISSVESGSVASRAGVRARLGGDEVAAVAATAAAAVASTAAPSGAPEQAGNLATEVPAEEAIDGYDYEGRPLLRWDDLEAAYPRFPTLDDIHRVVTDEDRAMFVDLRPYMNATPTVVHYRAPVMRAYRLMRELGLRHLPVIDDHYDIVGVLARAELVEGALHHAAAEKAKNDSMH